MLSFIPIKALESNYIWAIIHQPNKQAIIIDPGCANSAIEFLTTHDLSCHAVWVTHHHDDHTGGVATLLTHYPSAALYAHKDHGLNALSPIPADSHAPEAFGCLVEVWPTFGHTKSHLSYVLYDNKDMHIFCADTLFRAGCGRVFCGTIDELYHSFMRFNRLDETTIFYPAHEYTLTNLAFAQTLEPSNTAIISALTQDKNRRANDLPTLPTTLGDERQINPFIRALNAKPNDELWLNAEHKSGQSIKDNQTLFSVLRTLKDNF